MAKKTIKITDFGGITDDIRNQSFDFSMISNWESNTRTHILTPLRSMESDVTETTDDYNIQSFIALTDSNNSTNIYGVGVASNGDAHATFYEKIDNGDAASDWTPSTNGDGTLAMGKKETLCSYKQKLFCLRTSGSGSDTALVSYDPATNTLTETVDSPALLTGQQSLINPRPFVHPNTDILYMASGNEVWQYNNTDLTQKLVLPTDLVITSFTDYGKLLAISTQPKSEIGKSLVYFWDMVSTDVTSVVEWGNKPLKILENINSVLIGVSVPAPTSYSEYAYPSLSIDIYNNGSVENIKTIYCDRNQGVNFLSSSLKWKKDDVLYFPLKIVRNGTTFNQIFSFYKNDSGKWILRGSFLPNNDSSVSTINGFGFIEEHFFVAIDYSGIVMRTRDDATYSATSYFETIKFNDGDPTKTKQLVGVAVSTVSQPANSIVTIKYKKDSDSSFTTIGTSTTTNSVFKEFINIVSTGKNLPEFNEIQFRVESTGNAEITGFKFVFDDKKTLLP